MQRLAHARWLWLAVVISPVLPAPAAAQPGSGTGGMPTPQTAPGQPGDMAVDAPRTAFVRARVRIRGASRHARKRVVRVESRRAGGTWTAVARARGDAKGGWSAAWRPRQAGAYELRARIGGGSAGPTGGTAVSVEVEAGESASSTSLMVYEPAVATWYGPGFFGRQTACGIELTRETVGVAHRSLPCGTPVQIAFGQRVVVVPVIDRGPYANGADWDLTQAAAQQLGMTGTSRIGAIPLAPDR